VISTSQYNKSDKKIANRENVRAGGGVLAIWKSLAPPPTQAARTSTMSGTNRQWIAPSATPWDGKDPVKLNPAEALVKACHQDIYRYRHAPSSLKGEAEFFNAYVRAACPRCRSSLIEGRGLDPNGVKRWRCRSCGRSFSPATGTIFEGRKLPVADWTEFLLEVFSFESINAMTRANRRSQTTFPYWMAKLFAVLEDIQYTTVLSGVVQIDETLYPLAAKDQPLMPDGSKMPGGFSKSKICIGIGCDDKGNSVFKEEGLGKTSGAKTMTAFGSHIVPGSILVHDKENGHNRLVRELDLVSESYDSKKIRKLPDSQNPLGNVNRLCFLLKLFLDSHSGFDRDDLEGYLDLFWVIMNPPSSKMEKAALVLDRAMHNPKSLAYREFYRKKPC
jgi:transposase-like protein